MGILNDRIKEMRIKRGYTLAYVADKLGIKEATMQRYESGEIKNIKHETIVRLAEIFNCSPSYLMGWETTTNEEVSYESMHQLIARNGKNLTTEEKMELIKLLSELK